MKVLRLWTKDLFDLQVRVEEPMRPFALSYLAASGIFDKIIVVDPDGVEGNVVIDGAKLIRLADQVRPTATE